MKILKLNKYFYFGITICLISIALVSIQFDIPYQLNFDSLIKRINLEGFDMKPISMMITIIVSLSFMISFIPFRKLLYSTKFSVIFLSLNVLFLFLAIYTFIDSTIVYSKVSSEFRQPNF